MSQATEATVIRQIHSDYVDRLIAKARENIQEGVRPAHKYRRPEFVIARYVAAIAVNFTDWMGKTYPWVRHEIAQQALKDNLRCEQSQDHVGMLLDFARQAGVGMTNADFDHVSKQVETIRKLLGKVEGAGLVGLAILAVLEDASKVFIPVLEEMGRGLGVTDFTYTRIHGEADSKHSDAFIAALKAEQSMGYHEYEGQIYWATREAAGLVLRIFEKV